MSSGFIGNDSLFSALANANNNRDQQTYTIIRNLIDSEYRDRIPSTILPWDDLFAHDFEELASMVYERDIEVRTGNILQPVALMKIMAKNIRSLVKSPVWRKRLW